VNQRKKVWTRINTIEKKAIPGVPSNIIKKKEISKQLTIESEIKGVSKITIKKEEDVIEFINNAVYY